MLVSRSSNSYENLIIKLLYRGIVDLRPSSSPVRRFTNSATQVNLLGDKCRYIGANRQPFLGTMQKDGVAIALVSKLTQIIHWQCTRLIVGGRQLSLPLIVYSLIFNTRTSNIGSTASECIHIYICILNVTSIHCTHFWAMHS